MNNVSVKKLCLRAIMLNLEKRRYSIISKIFYRLVYNGLKLSHEKLIQEKKDLEEKIILEEKLKRQEEERINKLRYYFQRYYHNCRSNKILLAIKLEREKRIREKKIKKEKMLMKLVYNKEKKKNKFMLSMFMKLYYRGLYRQMIRGNINIVEIEKKKDEKPKQDSIISQNNAVSTQVETKVEQPFTKAKSTPIQSTISQTTSIAEQGKEDITLKGKPSIANKESIEDTISSLLPQTNEPKKEEVSTNVPKKEEEPKKNVKKLKEDSPELKKNKARNLRKLLNKKRQVASINLKVYFNRFHLGCLFTSMKSTLMRRSATIQPISEEIFKEEEEEKENKIQKLKEEFDKKQIEIEKKRIRTEREKEICIKFRKVFNRKERLIHLFIHSNLQKWNLRTKIIKIKELTKKPKRKMLRKTKTKASFDTSINKIKTELQLNNNADKECE